MNKIDLNSASQAEMARVRRAEEAPQTAQTAQTGGATASPDKVTVSGRASEAGRIAARVAELPDVRQERVEQLRLQVLSGDYDPPAADIADAILRDEG